MGRSMRLPVGYTMDAFNTSAFESLRFLLLASVIVVATAAILQEAWFAFRSSPLYKRGFAVMQSSYALKYNKVNRQLKETLFEKLKEGLQNVNGDVLELAIGSGANLEFFPSDTSLIALDANPHMEKILRANLAKFAHVSLKKFLMGNALDGVAVEDKSIAAVVCTKFLCILDDKEAMTIMQEIKRILKPGGRFIFLEHVAAEQGTLLRTLQDLLVSSGIWPSLFDGCMCNRESWHVLHQAGFRTLSYEKFYSIRPVTWLYHGLFVFYFVAPTMMGFAEV